MTVAALRDAIGLLARMPVLWLPGMIGGIGAAILWMTLFAAGSFFTSRLLVLFLLLFVLLTAGTLAVIRNNEGNPRTLLSGGIAYYFRVLLPQLVIGFFVLLVFLLCTITFALLGQASDIVLLVFLTVAIMIPTLVLTFFFDVAAVFEDRHVFASIQRSVLIVSDHLTEVLTYLIISALVFAGIVFTLMMVWEIILFDKLRPLMDFTDAQREAFTPDQLLAMIGPEGLWVTGLVIFLGVLILFPLLVSYKASFYRTLISGSARIEQLTYGEYDSKGRWYKY